MATIPRPFIVTAISIALLGAALFSLMPAKQAEPFIPIHQDGPRTWALDTDRMELKTEEDTDIEYLDFVSVLAIALQPMSTISNTLPPLKAAYGSR